MLPGWQQLILSIATIAMGVPAIAQTGAIAGIVVDADDNTPVSFVTLSIDNARYGTVSNDDGTYFLGGLPAGPHYISLSRIGYSINSDSIFVEVDPGDTTYLTVEMRQEALIAEEVVITAARKNQVTSHAPATVSIVSSREMDRKQIQTFDQALDDVAGLVVSRTSGSNVQSLSIRGSSETAGGGIGNRVLLLIDGRPSLSPESGGALWNLVPVSSVSRIEVVKGAYSSLFGSSAMGGVINAITREPTVDPKTTLHINYGFYANPPSYYNYNKYRDFNTIAFSHSQRLGKVSYLIDIARNQNDGHREKSGFTLYNLFGKVKYHFAPNRSLQLSANFNKINNDTPATWLNFNQPYEVADFRKDDYQEKIEGSADLHYSAVTNSNVKYSSRFYYYQNAQNFTFNADPENDSTNVNFGKQFVDSSSIDTWRIGNVSQVDVSLGNQHYLIAGIDAKFDKVVALPDTVLYGRHKAFEFGAYIQDEWQVGETVTFTGGVRFDYYEILDEHSEINVSPKIAVVYEPSERFSFRALFARAFRNPSIAERYIKFEQGGGLRFIPNPDLVSEKLSQSYEVGMTYKLSDKFSVDLSLYRNLYKDLISYIQISEPLEPLVFQVVNLKQAVMQGAEVQLAYKINNWLRIRAGYAYLDAKDTSPDRFNDNLAYKPKHTYSATAEFKYKQFELDLHTRGRSKLDEVFIYPDSTPDGYILFDSRLAYSINSKHSVYIAVNNIANTQYEEVERYRMPGRSYSAGVHFNF